MAHQISTKLPINSVDASIKLHGKGSEGTNSWFIKRREKNLMHVVWGCSR